MRLLAKKILGVVLLMAVTSDIKPRAGPRAITKEIKLPVLNKKHSLHHRIWLILYP